MKKIRQNLFTGIWWSIISLVVGSQSCRIRERESRKTILSEQSSSERGDESEKRKMSALQQSHKTSSFESPETQKKQPTHKACVCGIKKTKTPSSVTPGHVLSTHQPPPYIASFNKGGEPEYGGDLHREKHRHCCVGIRRGTRISQTMH